MFRNLGRKIIKFCGYRVNRLVRDFKVFDYLKVKIDVFDRFFIEISVLF